MPENPTATLKIREAGPADRQRWDGFLASQARGHVLQSWGWAEMERHRGFEPWRLLAEAGDHIAGVLSVLVRRTRFPKAALYYAPRGPVLEPGAFEALVALTAAVRERAAGDKAVLLKVDPYVGEEDALLADLQRAGFRPAPVACTHLGTQPPTTIRLPLEQDEDALLARMRARTRQYVRSAGKRGVVVREGGRDDVPEFLRLLTETQQRRGHTVPPPGFAWALWEQFVETGCGRLFLAEHEGRALTAAFGLVLGGNAWQFYPVAGDIPKDLRPNYLLVWEIMRWCKSRGCGWLDLRGIPRDPSPDHPLYGIYQFKSGFGGDVVHFTGEWDLPYRPLAYRAFQIAVPWLAARTLQKRSRALSSS